MPIKPDSFAMLCFLALMQNGEGLIDKSPDYITEKTSMLRAGHEAFVYLDIKNMRKVVDWCEVWGVTLPREIAEEYWRQQDAAMRLKAGGVDIT